MKRLLILLTSLLLLVATSSVTAQEDRRVEEQKKAIAALEKKIAAEEAAIGKLQKSRKTTEERARRLARQIEQRNQLLTATEREASRVEKEVARSSHMADSLAQALEHNRQQYNELAREAYRNYRQQNFTTYLFSADDFNSATRRIAAIRLVNDARQRKVHEIDSLTIQLDSARKVLDAEKVTLQDTRNRHNSELKKLSANERDYKKRLSTLSSREKKVLKAQQEQRRELERLVNSTRKSKGEAKIGGNIKDNRGRLPMPVVGGRLKPNGSDIAEITGAQGAQVKSVFNGEVMRVTYNRNTKSYIVLIGHGQYFTTYSNMATATVKEGQKVTVGQAIGSIGRAVDASGRTEYKLVFGLFAPNGDTLDADQWLK